MIGISGVEGLIIIIIAIIIIDPKDWPKIIQTGRYYWSRLTDAYQEIMGQLSISDISDNPNNKTNNKR